MSNKVELKGTIEKVTRENGKAGATMSVTIPISKSTEVPLGAVNISIEEAQQTLLPQTPAKPKKVRGDRG